MATPAINLQLHSIWEAKPWTKLMLKLNRKYQTFISRFLGKVEVRPPPLIQVLGTGEHLEHGQAEGGGLCAPELYEGGKRDKAICRAPSLLRN